MADALILRLVSPSSLSRRLARNAVGNDLPDSLTHLSAPSLYIRVKLTVADRVEAGGQDAASARAARPHANRLIRNFAALAGLFCGTVHAVDAARFMPFDEAPFGPYRAQVCDKFLDRDDRIRFLAPALSGEKLERLLARCPGLLDIDQRVQVDPSGIALYETDIDNDGSSDQVLYVQNRYRHLPSESFFKLDLESCKLTRLFGAARSNHLFTLEGRTYIESLQRCKGPIKILGALRYLNCTLIYESKGTELRPFRDELCAFIDRAWTRRRAGGPGL